MLDSDFWRELAAAFRECITSHEDFSAARSYYMNQKVGEWRLIGSEAAIVEFDALARRSAARITTALVDDLTTVWLEALWERATTGPVRTPSEVVKEYPNGLLYLRGTIKTVFQASSSLCRIREAEALQVEFTERQQTNPKNWSPFRREYEAFKSLESIITEPAERIPEEFARNAIARIYGIKPEDVTREQIAFEVAGLLSATKRHIELIPSTIQLGSPSTFNDEESETQSEPGSAKQPQVEQPETTSVAAETVAAQIKRLRDECRWTNEQLAEVAQLSTRQVARHVLGEAMPYKRNIAAYERVFTKKLKRQIVISKKS